MPFLEIVHLSGDIERRPLEKQQPVSVGSHSSNDLRIDEDGVESLHCRISWNKKAFEAVAAGVEGIDINGTVVQRAALKQGDVLRFGTVDVRFMEREADEAEMPELAGIAPLDSGSIGLKPLSEEVQVPDWLRGTNEAKAKAFQHPSSKQPEAPRAEPEAPRAVSRPKPSSPKAPEAKASRPKDAAAERPPEKPSKRSSSRDSDDDELDGFDLDAGLEALAAESRAEMPVRRQVPDTAEYNQPKQKPRPAAPARAASPPPPPAKAPEPAPIAEPSPVPTVAPAPVAPMAAIPRRDEKIRKALRHQRARPGEEDIFKSPLVLGLGALAIGALVLAAIFYFVGFRRSIQEEFDNAKTLFSENKFAPAVEALNLFISKHGEHALAADAKRLLGLATVDDQISGAAPKYAAGMKELKNLANEQRTATDFASFQREIEKRAADIALGSARAAGKVFDSSLLDVARDAKGTLQAYASKETPPTELFKDIDRAIEQSTAAILKHNTHDEQLAQISAAVKEKRPLDALRLRRELLARYPDLVTDKRVVASTKEMLESERSLVKEEPLDKPPVKDPLASPKSLTLVYQARTRTDQVSVNRAVPVVSHGTLFGIDTVTGGPVWKQAVGVDTPFFPVRDTATNSLIAFNSPRNEVLRIDQNSGAILWRQPLEERASARPLIDAGQVFVATVNGRLYRIELDGGTLVSRLSFSQTISNPVALSEGDRIVVCGDREVFYTLTSRPFACAAVSYLGQPSKSIAAPLLSMGPYILACQNESESSCKLRLVTTVPENEPLKEVAAFDVTGQVVDTPVVRGRNLFVPSTDERVAAFQISDAQSQAPMVAGPKYEVKGAQPCITQLSAAPDDQLFMASTAVRKLELKVDSLQPSQEAILLGRVTQPLQYVDRMLYVARQRPFAESIVLTPIDRVSLSGEWQAIAGARIVASSVVSGDNPSIVCVTESGQLFRVTPKSLDGGGFLSVAERLPLNEELAVPLLATAIGEGQIVVAAGLPEPKMWVVNRLGQIERTNLLTSPLQAAPAALGKIILAPVAGRLQALQSQGNQPAAQELRLPGDLEGSTKWVRVFAVDADSAVGALENGTILGVRLQKSPQPHLSEAGRFSLQAPLAGQPAFSNGRVAVAAVNGRVAVLAGDSVEPRGEKAFAGQIAGGPWLTDDLVFVEPGDGTLQALSIARDLPPQWSLPLAGDHVAGNPLVRNGEVIIPLQAGKVVRCDVADGEIKGTVDLQSALSGAPFVVGNTVFVTTLDGGLIRVEAAQP